jgi:outer membrane protein OmpA-like peptidoglycan-associated protein
MIQQLRFSALCLFLIAAPLAQANVCGSDLQNFNPTSNNLNFVTVQSSATLDPCLVNFGMFFDYAVNTLTYSRDVVANQGLEGNKVKNALLSGQFSFGMGITKNWDVGINLPFVMSQELKDKIGTASFARAGVNEVRLNTKYRFYGRPSNGAAFVFSLGQNTIENNPFAGEGAGPSAVFELAMDTKWEGGFSGAFNLGYKKRLAGDPIPDQPFIPMKDQYLYSLAGGYLFGDLKSKIIAEIYSALPVSRQDQNTNKNLNSTEFNLGLKHRYSRRATFHIGAGSKLFESFGAPDFRIYTGMTWFLGPVCNVNADKGDPKYPYLEPRAEPRIGDPVDPIQYPFDGIPFDEYEDALPEPTELGGAGSPDIYRFDIDVLFETDSAVVKQSYQRTLVRLAQKLRSEGFRYLVVAGHTDSVGAEEYNRSLSERRSQAVKAVLLRSGVISSEQVQTEAYGERMPIATNDTAQGRQKNRRVDLQVWR